jgi:hypothetical protein
MYVGTPCTRGAPSRNPHALYTRHEVLAYKPTTAQYPVGCRAVEEQRRFRLFPL